MKNKPTPWNKMELQTYILLLCASADSVASEAEIQLIRTKADPATFKKIYEEFKTDTEDESLEKIEDNLEWHDYSSKELAQIRKEMHAVFSVDKRYHMAERNIDRILDNLLY
ncbi:MULTISPECIES: hypothetical protein [Altibacter]|uniref:hypothetical protein n=1 Tax=Altibacter TaxID=1535231 RepID=UPI0005535335|nr:MULTISPECIES: hypothetical protein [Altibacter]MCW8981151.1 hypothetical protein [Altibacter sp.]MCW9038718.1 hypothetical protein [Altibacter sp.]